MQSSLQSPVFYYSPQTAQTPGIFPATISTFPTHGSPLSHKPGGLEHPSQVTNTVNSPAAFQECHSSKQHSDLEPKAGRISTRVSPGSTLGYQPQNDDEIIQQKKPVPEVSSTGSRREGQSSSCNHETATTTDHEAQVASKTCSNTNTDSMDPQLLHHQRTKHRVHFQNLPMPARATTDSSAGQPLSSLSQAAQSTKGILSPQHLESSLLPDSVEGQPLVAGTHQPEFSPHKHLPPIPTPDDALPSQESTTPYEGTCMLSYGHTK